MKKKLFIILCIIGISLVGCKGGSNTISSSLSDVSIALEDAGLLTDETIEPLYSMIGAVGGFKSVRDKIEVYEYDVKSDTYKKILKNNEITIEGFGATMPVTSINGQYVLFCDDAPNKDEIISVFTELE